MFLIYAIRRTYEEYALQLEHIFEQSDGMCLKIKSDTQFPARLLTRETLYHKSKLVCSYNLKLNLKRLTFIRRVNSQRK